MQPPLPGNDPAPLAQPPKFNRGSPSQTHPTQIQTAPLPPRASPDIARPQPRARMPQELLPQAEQNPRVAPAEPARIPPGAPPTIRQPPKAPVAQAAPPPQPLQRAEPAPVAQPAPRAEPPRPKEAVRELSRSKQLQ